MAVKAPRLPRTPPQKHHKNTTPAPLFSSKTPAKALIHHSKKTLPILRFTLLRNQKSRLNRQTVQATLIYRRIVRIDAATGCS
jgi:hypothetical protein